MAVHHRDREPGELVFGAAEVDDEGGVEDGGIRGLAARALFCSFLIAVVSRHCELCSEIRPRDTWCGEMGGMQ